jgi:D-serine deaminase-like pyridoxal phosphate-dependent protein
VLAQGRSVWRAVRVQIFVEIDCLHFVLFVTAMDDKVYRIEGASDLLTPTLAIYVDIVERNIATTLKLFENIPGRWRPHVKTAKLLRVMKMLTTKGVSNFKCATTLELVAACEAGARDVVFAFPTVGATARRVIDIARSFPEISIAVLVDSASQVSQWRNTPLGVFVDVNPGMDRTGVSQEEPELVVKLVNDVLHSGIPFRGLHYYDGHLRSPDLDIRTQEAHRGYDCLLKIVHFLQARGFDVPEVITAGTPTFPCTLTYKEFLDSSFIHRASPGTVIYGDLLSRELIPQKFGYETAALVLSRVVSHPSPVVVTCDAGHKTISMDSGVPNCAVLGWESLVPLRPSEEHLPIRAPSDSRKPSTGEIIYLAPKHICPTVNNFSDALIIEKGKVTAIDRVTARGHETAFV